MAASIKIKNTDPNACETLGGLLGALRDKAHDPAFNWEAATVGDEENGTMKFTLQLNAKPQPKAPPEVKG